MRKVEISKKFEQMLISAERYACGRMTYIVSDTVDYILSLLPHLSDWCLSIMERDMKEAFAMHARLESFDRSALGMDCDKKKWAEFSNAISKEIERRKR